MQCHTQSGNTTTALKVKIYLPYLYCSRFQVELNSTWNHNMPCTTGKAEAGTSSRIASGRQHRGHKINFRPETSLMLFYIGSYFFP